MKGDIVSRRFLDRTTEEFVHDGMISVTARNPGNTIAYYDNGVLRPINVQFGEETYTKNVSGLWLRKKNARSVGIRLDGQLQKYLGLRPDDCQDGSEQFELSIENIKFNDNNEKVVLNNYFQRENEKVDKIGNLISVQAYRKGCRQLVRATNKVRGFEITYRVDIKGLFLVRKPEIDEFWFVSQKDLKVKFIIRKPKFVDCKTGNILKSIDSNGKEIIKHSLVLQPDGSYLYIKESTDDLEKYKLPAEFYIDADIVYSGSGDGYCRHYGTPWATVRSYYTSAIVDTGDDWAYESMLAQQSSSYYYIQRSFFYFELSGLDAITYEYAYIYIYGAETTNDTCEVQQGTQGDSLAKTDYDNFSGNYWGTCAAWKSGYNKIDLDATGLAAANAKVGVGTFKVCAREYNHEYLNSTPPSSTMWACGCFYGDYTGTSRDPYIMLSAEKIKNLMGVAHDSVKKFVGVGTDDIDKIIGLDW